MYKIFSLYLLLSILRPAPVEILGDFFGMRIIDAIYFCIAAIFFMLLLLKKEGRIKYTFVHLCFGLFFLIQLISLSFNSMFSNIAIINRDLYELYRIPFYAIIFSFSFGLEWNIQKMRKYFYRPMVVGVLINFFLIILQLNSKWFENKSRLIYGGKLSVSSNFWQSRVIGTFYNPNFFGIFIATVIVVCFINVLVRKEKRIGSFLLGLGALPFLYLSNSRTAFFALIFSITVSLSIWAFLYIKTKPLMFIKGFSFLVIIFFIARVFLFSSWRFYEIYSLIISGDFTVSKNLSGRIFHWINALSYFINSPLIGMGPSKAIFSIYDSNYVSIIVRYGIIGIILFICLWGKLLISSLKSAIKYKKEISFQFLAVTIIIIIGMITANFFNVQQLMTIFFLYAGAAYKLFFDNINNKAFDCKTPQKYL